MKEPLTGDAALRQALADVCQRAARRGLVHASAGNASLRFGEAIWISPRGSGLETVLPDEMIRISPAGERLWGVGEPSSEWPLHAALYQAVPEAGGIVHTHSPWATGLAILERHLPLATIEAATLLGDVPLVPYAPSGTQELAEAAAAAAKAHGPEGALLLARHGVVAWGRNLEAAYRLADLVEATARQAYIVAAWRGAGEGS